MKRAAVSALLTATAFVFPGGPPEARSADGEPPVFTRHPQPTAVPYGHTAVLAADTAFEPTLRWRWMKNGNVIPGAVSNRLPLFNTGEEDTAEYHAVAVSDAGERWSPPAAVIVLPRETAAGRVDEKFADPGLDGPVNALAEREDGAVIAGGEFFSARGITNTTRLVKLLPDGTPDAVFRAGKQGPDSAVLALAASGNGMWAAGAFRAFDGAPAPGLVKLRADGSRDTAFLPALPANVEDVRSLAPLPDGRLYVGGRSRSGAGVADWLVRLLPDGARDLSFLTPSFLNGRLRALAPLPDGRVWLGGNFFRPAGSAAHYNRIALIGPFGQTDPGFRPPAGANSGANLEVRCLQAMPDGSVTAGGIFSKADALTRYGLARFRADGGADPGFTPPVLDDGVLSLGLDAAGRLYAGGDFSQAGVIPTRSIARFLPDGAVDTSWRPPMSNGPFQTLLFTPKGLWCAGAFNLPRNAVARLLLEPRASSATSSAVSLPLTEPARLFRRAQALGSFTGPASVPDGGAAAFPVSISPEGITEELRVWLDLRCADVQPLTLSLESPEGAVVALVTAGKLRHGADFRRTMFTSHSLRPLTQAGPPYTDALQPESSTATAFTGRPAAGTWTLRVSDTRQDDRAAVLLSWTLEIFTSPAAPSFQAWLAGRSGSAEEFSAYTFGQPRGTFPLAEFAPLTRTLTHRGWPADGGAVFRYEVSEDLVNWRTVTPAALRKTILPRETIIAADMPVPHTPRAWWRVRSTRSDTAPPP